MKKFIYSVIAMLALGCTFVACSSDDDDPSYNFTSSAEQGSAGTYTGEWTRTSDDGTVETFAGTITSRSLSPMHLSMPPLSLMCGMPIMAISSITSW